MCILIKKKNSFQLKASSPWLFPIPHFWAKIMVGPTGSTSSHLSALPHIHWLFPSQNRGI